MKYKGDLVITKENQNNFKKLVEVSGSIHVSENATLTAPKLEKSGSIYVRANATLTAPKLEKSGHIHVSENATLTAPKLEKSGHIYVSENATLTAPKLEVKDDSAKVSNKHFSIKYNDGIPFFIDGERTFKGINVYSGLVNLKISNGKVLGYKSYLAEKKGFSSHGDTLKSAINDLHFKIAQEKIKKDPIKKETVIDDNYYRAVTGACSFGVKQWRKQNGIEKESITAKELLPMLRQTNAFGLQKFESLITF